MSRPQWPDSHQLLSDEPGAIHFIVDVDERNLRCDEANASDRVVFGCSLIIRRQDFRVAWRMPAAHGRGACSIQ